MLWNQVAVHFNITLSLAQGCFRARRACIWSFVFSLKQLRGRKKGKVFLPLCTAVQGLCKYIPALLPQADWEGQGGWPHALHFLFSVYVLEDFSFQIYNNGYMSLTEEMPFFGICGKSRASEEEKALNLNYIYSHLLYCWSLAAVSGHWRSQQGVFNQRTNYQTMGSLDLLWVLFLLNAFM